MNINLPEDFEEESLEDVLVRIVAIDGIRDQVEKNLNTVKQGEREHYRIPSYLLERWKKQSENAQIEFKKRLREARKRGDADWIVAWEELENSVKECRNACLRLLRFRS